MVFKRRLNPMVDVLFKFIFGAEEREEYQRNETVGSMARLFIQKNDGCRKE